MSIPMLCVLSYMRSDCMRAAQEVLPGPHPIMMTLSPSSSARFAQLQQVVQLECMGILSVPHPIIMTLRPGLSASSPNVAPSAASFPSLVLSPMSFCRLG